MKRPKVWCIGRLFALITVAGVTLLSGCTPIGVSQKHTVSASTSPAILQVADPNSQTGSKSSSPSTNTVTTTNTVPPSSNKTTSSVNATQPNSTLTDALPAATIKKPTPTPTIQLGDKTPAASSLNEALSLLGYLPLSFTPAHGITPSTAMTTIASSPTVPLPGSYHFRKAATAHQLGSEWAPLQANVMTEGAVMQFELNHHLVVDGIAGPHVWSALQAALKKHQVTSLPYVFITVDEHATEVLKVWRDGKVVLTTPANTGIAQSPTSIGTWPIYLRYQSQEMKGTTPSGAHYDDPGVPYVSYFHGGDAVHGFSRQSYGYPQSLGCVEIPIAIAKTVYSLVNYGTLVSVRK